MLFDLYQKRNDRKVSFLYPIHGRANILRRVEGVKLKSFTGPNGRGITVTEKNGETRSFLVKKCVSL